jgi:surfeit locus 1 family protein
MAKALNAANPAPVFLFAETSTNPDMSALRPIAVPPEISNRHLEYALTWFGLAAALASVYVGMLIRRRRN